MAARKKLPEGREMVENRVKNTVLHLGDGRRLVYGEKGEVSADVAELLRSRNQVY